MRSKEYKSDCCIKLREKLGGIRYFPANGNHDGTIWDISYLDAPVSTNHLLPDERYELFYNHLANFDDVHFGKQNSLYYYYDDRKDTKNRPRKLIGSRGRFLIWF